MTGKIEYLEKYSVAPSPSRDYYGLKVLRDQVILYLWKISHGPHKTPIVRTSNFNDFQHDKPLQDEIQRIFGEYLLKHIRNIAAGQRNTLITLPKCLTEKLVRYLSVNDIVKLSSLSHAAKEVFNDNSVWETLYKKYKPLTKNKYEKLYATTHNWKQLLQLAQMQGVMNDLKVPRARLASKQTKTNSKLEDTTKPSSAVSRGMSRIVSSVSQASKKPSDTTRKKPTQNLVPKKSDIRLDRCTIDNETISSEKKVPTIKSFQTIGQKNLKAMRDQSKTLKIDSKREAESKDSLASRPVEVKQTKGQVKVRRTDARVSSTSIRMEDKSNPVKTRNLAAPKATRSEKPAPCSIQGGQAKLKARGKPKKIGQSKSTILSTNSALVAEHSAVRDDSFDLADLIEASLKNIRSPRSIFDYSFSCIEKPKSCAGDSKAGDEYRRIGEPPRGLKSSRARETLDRLSEKSEPLTAKSVDSVDKSDASCGSATPKYVKTLKTKTKMQAELIKNRYKIPMPEDKVDTLERYGIYNKYPTPRMNDNVEPKRVNSQKTVDKMEALRSLDANNSFGRRVTPGKAADANRYNLRKAVGGLHKH